jgi:hypothetical protein
LEKLVHRLGVEAGEDMARFDMAGFKVELAPQPAAPASSSVVTNTSEQGIKSQFRFGALAAPLAKIFSRQLANTLLALLTPAAVVAFVMGLWRVCADLGWAGAFLIADGLFSHWQVWIALSIALKMLSSTLIAWGSRTGKFSEEN